MSTAHDQKARFVTSSDVTSQKRNLRIQMDKSFNFMCTVFLQSITVSGYIPTKKKPLGVLIF